MSPRVIPRVMRSVMRSGVRCSPRWPSRGSRTLLLALGCAALASCDTPTASRPVAAYDPTTLTGGLTYRWASGTTVRVWVAGQETPAPFDLGIAVRRAMVQWNAVPQFAEFTLATAASAGEADLIVYDREQPAPTLAGSCTFDPRNAAGYTYFCPGGGQPPRAERLRLTSDDMRSVSVVIRVDRGRASSQAALNALVAHEFGHALGIGGHSDEPSDLMFGLPTVESPGARDRATLRDVLGRISGLTL